MVLLPFLPSLLSRHLLQCCVREGWAVAALRSLSTQPSSPSFKAQTRALLKKIHPDLFQHPEAKEANERSFKLLQEYLAAAKTGGGIGRTAGLPYHFTFFIHDEASVAEEAEEAGGASEGSAPSAPPTNLKRVSLTLPPPIKSQPGDSLSPSTRKAFSRLLEACGIPSDLPPDTHQPRYSRLTSLRDFIPQAVEEVHQAAVQQAGPRQQLAMARAALKMGRSVVLSFAEPAASAGVVQQLALAQQLVAALDGLPGLDMRGLRVTVGEAYGVDALGTIWLHAGDSLQAWARYLSAVDTAYCHERQALLGRVRGQEASLARLLGVPMLYTHPQLSLDPAYLEFLQRTTAAAAELGPAGGGRLGEVPVMVVPDASQSLDADAGGPDRGSGGGGSEGPDPLSAPSLDDAAGVMLVPVSTAPATLYAALARLGPAARAALARAREEEAAAAQLRRAVERKLRLRRLSREPALAPEHFRSACMRLMQHSAAVGPLLEGLAVRVAEVNGLPADRSHIDIAWDFEP